MRCCCARPALSGQPLQKVIAAGTDWRFLNEIKRELKA
jgi:hypothetical protein